MMNRKAGMLYTGPYQEPKNCWSTTEWDIQLKIMLAWLEGAALSMRVSFDIPPAVPWTFCFTRATTPVSSVLHALPWNPVEKFVLEGATTVRALGLF